LVGSIHRSGRRSLPRLKQKLWPKVALGMTVDKKRLYQEEILKRPTTQTKADTYHPLLGKMMTSRSNSMTMLDNLVTSPALT